VGRQQHQQELTLWHAEGMTEQPFGGAGETPPPYYPPPNYPPPNYPPPNFPPPYYPPPGFSPDPAAPYGRNPITGEPFSDKSKVVAGLLQLLGLVGVLGVGRLYLGYTTLGTLQLVGGLVLGLVTCGIGFIVPVVWGIVDAVLILTDKVRDPSGRPLRDAV
jgi:TM2 domain-containing membrane protein YozV